MRVLILAILIVLSTGSDAFAASSRTIRNEIAEKIDQIEDLGGHEIEIEVRSGAVTLQGYIASEADREKVLDVVRAVDGVDEFEDRLTIRASSATGGAGRVNELALAVKNSIAAYVKNSSYDVQINVTGSVVTLTGDVFSTKDREELEQAALRTPGITSVNNQLNVTESDDETLAKVVEIELTSTPTIKSQDLRVTSENGVVTLSGRVSSGKDIGEALAIVLNIPGVRDVKNELKVGRK